MSHPHGSYGSSTDPYGPPANQVSYGAPPGAYGQAGPVPDVTPSQRGYEQPYAAPVPGRTYGQSAATTQEPSYQAPYAPSQPVENGHVADAYAQPGQKRNRDDDYGPNKRVVTEEPYFGPETVFRMLCEQQKLGPLLSNPAIIKQIQDKTGARVHCVQQAPRGCEEKVLIIWGPSAKLQGQEFNSAQLALFDVFERLMVAEQGHGSIPNPNANFR